MSVTYMLAYFHFRYLISECLLDGVCLVQTLYVFSRDTIFLSEGRTRGVTRGGGARGAVAPGASLRGAPNQGDAFFFFFFFLKFGKFFVYIFHYLTF